MSKDSVWYVFDNEKIFGPLTHSDLTHKLDKGQLKPDDLVWRKGSRDWQKLAAVLQTTPSSSTEAWYVNNGGLSFGPVDLETLIDTARKKELPLEARVWTSGLTKWVALYEVPELSETLKISRRKFFRAPFAGKVFVEGYDAQTKLLTRTLGLGGIGISGLTKSPPGARVRLIVNSPMLKSALYAQAKVVYNDGSQAGLQFVDLSDENKKAVAEFVAQFENALDLSLPA